VSIDRLDAESRYAREPSHYGEIARGGMGAVLRELPADEQKAWQAFWAKVDELLKKADAL
jgi:hypothetical protein